ncbi:hypothetical protein [Massilia phosphatilytica]
MHRLHAGPHAVRGHRPGQRAGTALGSGPANIDLGVLARAATCRTRAGGRAQVLDHPTNSSVLTLRLKQPNL